MALFTKLKEEKMIAILRGYTFDEATHTVDALIEGGIRFLEVTMNTDGALHMVNQWRETYDQRAYIGVGTVLDEDMAWDAIQAGAQFIITPNLDERVVKVALDNEVDIWPGTFTPSEIVRATNLGVDAVKIFPLASLGISYLKEIRAPLDHIPMIATGGVTLENMHEYFNAGASAVGIGSSLVNKKLIQSGHFEELTVLAKQFVDKVK
ncbi:bifunctional 4-hydroxy-2-oxoglutarate aldolase/2-dehydro-3-deoxy-phosphogluconate aldolase [Chengkuizengella axinellae]|uniref:Bifunctional 4-hydroxy-2-oxoglutarate aldolase/2-dehydro-3-deoxy-phosphogluconate aldolase n=1 Tax=Chengkuizengella axinellae TaxID=3064388 RepID=A0ABT9IU17_9BACL|nr:bifunctional 4-hydroxy-2-oxoglutarate aldolase/2-dehydro-3-deoxy-phosphogluconate aldolase [Chengkuizengella sp. 2205SS18-9]MDP5272797.1 bifunctional 4-hydroxy-2-oxoglutarate aldolase/2-dehydro-3-deoxy-phosphogluconate aldolase [Chengkuizengella sp. 2205SS18-9]